MPLSSGLVLKGENSWVDLVISNSIAVKVASSWPCGNAIPKAWELWAPFIMGDVTDACANLNLTCVVSMVSVGSELCLGLLCGGACFRTLSGVLCAAGFLSWEFMAGFAVVMCLGLG